MEDNKFRTQKGYDLTNEKTVTRAMEDYLEMICRQSDKEGYIRISTLAGLLNVKASSASKMASNLKELGLVEFEKYGIIKPTKKGQSLGNYLLYRHNVLNRFFSFLNQSEDELEQTEQIEHYMNEKTVRNMERLLERLEKVDFSW